jgi:hypothetical protein
MKTTNTSKRCLKQESLNAWKKEIPFAVVSIQRSSGPALCPCTSLSIA